MIVFNEFVALMRKLFILCWILLATTAKASDSLQINFTTKTFVKGDTLEFSCKVPNFVALRLSLIHI